MNEFYLVPGAEGWNLISRPAENGNWRVRAFPTLDEAAQTLSTGDSVVLALPVSAVAAVHYGNENPVGAAVLDVRRATRSCAP